MLTVCNDVSTPVLNSPEGNIGTQWVHTMRGYATTRQGGMRKRRKRVDRPRHLLATWMQTYNDERCCEVDGGR